MNQVRDRLPADALAIVLDTYQVAIYYAFLFCFVIALFGVLSSLFIRQNTLDNKVRKWGKRIVYIYFYRLEREKINSLQQEYLYK